MNKLSKNDVKNIIKNSEWYDQGSEGKMLYMSIPNYATAFTVLKFHKQGYEKLFTFSIKGFGYWGLQMEALDRLSNYVTENHNKDPDFLKNLVKLHHEKEQEIDAALETVKDLHKL